MIGVNISLDITKGWPADNFIRKISADQPFMLYYRSGCSTTTTFIQHQLNCHLKSAQLN